MVIDQVLTILDWLLQRLWVRVLLSYVFWPLVIGTFVLLEPKYPFSFHKKIYCYTVPLSVQAVITEYYRLVVYKQQKSLSQSSGGWEVQIKVTADLISGEGLCPGS